MINAKKRTVVIFTVTQVILALAIYFVFGYVKFEPLTVKRSYEPLPVESKFYINLEKVLKYYNESYKVIDGKVYVRRIKRFDKDLMWNYTTKALDTAWLASH